MKMRTPFVVLTDSGVVQFELEKAAAMYATVAKERGMFAEVWAW